MLKKILNHPEQPANRHINMQFFLHLPPERLSGRFLQFSATSWQKTVATRHRLLHQDFPVTYGYARYAITEA